MNATPYPETVRSYLRDALAVVDAMLTERQHEGFVNVVDYAAYVQEANTIRLRVQAALDIIEESLSWYKGDTPVEFKRL